MVDTSTPVKVAKYTIASSLAGALLTAAYESTRGQAKGRQAYEAEQAQRAPRTALGPAQLHPYRHPIGLYVGSAALNSGTIAFCFFSLREYLITPALNTYKEYRHREGVIDKLQGPRGLTWADMRLRNVPDTAITGAILGASYNTWRRGPIGIPAGTITATLMCTLIQLMVNEADIGRIKYVSKRLQQPTETITLPPTRSSSSVENILSSPPSEAIPRSPTPPLPHEPSRPSSIASSSSDSPTLTQRLLGLIGVKKMSDEEYLDRLKKRRDGYLKRIEELEEQERQRHEKEDSS